MNTSFWAPYISDGTIKAICWTLIHSLWIGLVIALLCGIVISVTRKSAAILRYRLLCSLLLVFVCSIGITYYLEATSIPASATTGKIGGTLITGHNDIVFNHTIIPQNSSLLSGVRAFLNQNASIIFMIWLLFFMLKSLKMVSGLLYIQRIRNYKTHVVTEELKHKIEQLSSQMGIRRVVRLVQSELVKVPVAVGWLKPVILLPLGIALQLTPEQLDGILWHELAHIYRRDYLVNILQGLVETVFFFNPGLLWLSSLIRTERESCCDDMVLSRMNLKANYLEALLSFGYGEFKQASFAMSIGSGNQLRDRLKRMISQENKRLSVAEKSVLAIGLVLLSAFTTISKETIKFSGKSGKVVTKTMTETVTVSMHRPSANQRVNNSRAGNPEKDAIVVADTVVRFISIMLKHGDVDWTNNDLSAVDDKGNKYHFIVADGKTASMELNGVKIEESKLSGYEYTLQLIISELMEKRRELEGQRRLLAEQQQHLVAQQNAERERNIKQQQLIQTLRADQARKPQQPAAPIMSMDLQPAISGIISDLVGANVISDKSELIKFNLTNSALMVNGKKQPDELHDRLKAKYLEQPDYINNSGMTNDPNFGLHFNAQSGLMGIGTTEGPDSP